MIMSSIINKINNILDMCLCLMLIYIANYSIKAIHILYTQPL